MRGPLFFSPYSAMKLYPALTSARQDGALSGAGLDRAGAQTRRMTGTSPPGLPYAAAYDEEEA